MALTTRSTWIFTFGYGQVDPRTGRPLADCYVVVDVDKDATGRPDLQAARRQMLNRFGNAGGAGNWAFDYPDEEAAGVARYRLTQIDFVTGRVIAMTGEE